MPRKKSTSGPTLVPFTGGRDEQAIERHATALDLLKQLVAEIEAGRVSPDKLMVFFLSGNVETGLTPGHWCVNVSLTERIAYAELMKTLSISEWVE